MDDQQLAAIARDLLRVTPEDFVRERTARAREIRSEDKALAAAVGRLRKPVPAAWVIDLLAAQGVLDEAVALGPALRAAQEHADPAEIRRLRRQRADLVESLGRAGADLAADAGHEIGGAVGEQLAATIEAAMADPRAGAAVRSGLLVRALESVGFEPVDLDGALAVPGAVPEATEPPPAEAEGDLTDLLRASRPTRGGRAAKPEREQEQEQEQPPERDHSAVDAAREAVTAADAAVDELDTRIDEAEARRRDLDDRRHDLERELREVRRALTDAGRAREWLDGEHEAAERAADDARAALSRAEREHRARG